MCTPYLVNYKVKPTEEIRGEFIKDLKLLIPDIVFIYSEYVIDGVNMMAMALEANGYYRFHSEQKWNVDKLQWDGPNNNMLGKNQLRQIYLGNMPNNNNNNNADIKDQQDEIKLRD